MASKMILELPVKPEKLDEFVGTVKGALPDTRAFDGCRHLEFWTAADGSGRVLLYEVWETKAHQEKYMAWRAETGFLEVLGPFLTGEPKVTWLDEHEF